MTYILIVIFLGNSTAATSSLEVPGFTSVNECETAGMQILTGRPRTDATYALSWVCIEQTKGVNHVNHKNKK